MNANKHLVRGKDTVTGEWRVGYLVMIDGNPHIIEDCDIIEDGHHFRQESDRPTWVDPKTVGSIAPRQDTNGKNVFDGDIIEFNDSMFDHHIKAVVKFGEYLQDGSRGEYTSSKVYGWYVEVLSTTPPEWDDDSEYPKYLKTQSILEIPSFTVVKNQWDI